MNAFGRFVCVLVYLLFREIMKDSRYDLVPLHKRPDLLQECCNLLNSEWKRSETARLRSLNVSSDKFPICLLFLNKNKILGHCKVSLVNNLEDTVFLESLIIDHAHRSQGLGSILLYEVEDYIQKKGIKCVYLATKGQERFYLKNGYTICEPIQQLCDYRDFNMDSFSTNLSNTKSKPKETYTAGPPPPPMPIAMKKSPIPVCLTIPKRTFMMKKLNF